MHHRHVRQQALSFRKCFPRKTFPWFSSVRENPTCGSSISDPSSGSRRWILELRRCFTNPLHLTDVMRIFRVTVQPEHGRRLTLLRERAGGVATRPADLQPRERGGHRRDVPVLRAHELCARHRRAGVCLPTVRHEVLPLIGQN